MVATPYTTNDLENVLAEVSGDKQFAETFFARYIQGRDVIAYGPLLERAGLTLRKRNAGRAYFTGMQQLNFQGGGGGRVSAPVLFESALYKAGVDRDDLIVSIDGVNATAQDTVNQVLGTHKPGDQVPMRFVRRSGETVTGTLTLEDDPRMEIVAVEQAGGTLTPAQKQFREAWLGSRRK